MALINIDYGNVGVGKSFLEMLMEKEFLNAGSGSADQTFTAEIGKKYLIVTIRASSSNPAKNAGISSGATVDKVFLDNLKNSGSSITDTGEKMCIYIATATDTTIAMLGTNNICVYMPLDD